MLPLLKEWAVVCQALARGSQIFIARKGGISEAEGEFIVAHREFFLFPTYLHQDRESIKSQYHLDLQMIEEDEPREEKIHLNLFARVTDERVVSNINQLKGLSDHHIWNTKVLEDRFEWGSEKKLTLLVVRAYHLSEPILLPFRKSYAGCKSWVFPETDPKIPPGIWPVLSDVEFFEKRRQLLSDLTSSQT